MVEESDKLAAEACFKEATAKCKRGGYDEAVALYDKALELDPNNPKIYCNRAVARVYLNDIEGAIADCDRAIQLQPMYSGAYCNRGMAKASMGNYKGALLDFEKAVELNPAIPEGWNNRAICKYKLGDFKGAIEDWHKAIEINPGYKDLLQLDIDRASVKLKDLNMQPITDKPAPVVSEYAEAYFERALSKALARDYRGAIDDYTKASKLSPDDPEILKKRGLAKIMVGDNIGAISDWENAIRLNPAYRDNLQPRINQARAKMMARR
ncbi:tetratricopeptide repeat protein [Candidatus Peregrinibacteria bacterium]|nr:tetratricopeptide repeat protein [Candidatus Peregrinibacteria bacterium]